MSFSVQGDGLGEFRVPAGGVLVLRVAAYDPAGISRISVQCYQFSIGNSNRAKLAVGDVRVATDNQFSRASFEVSVPIPENAAMGKWGVQVIEFTNGRGYKSSFYRGQGKFDDIVFEVVAPPSRDDHPLQLNGVKIAGFRPNM